MQGYDSTSYGEAFADVYDDWYGDISDVDMTVQMLADLSRAAGPELPLVELGVGTGRLALPLAALVAPSPVIGIDSSAAMLSRLRAKATPATSGTPHSGGVTTILGDMVDGLPDGPLGLVFVAFNTFFNLDSAARQQACFQAVASRLAPGGAFVIEADVPDDPAHSGSHVEVKTIAVDRVVLSVARYDGSTNQAEGQFVEFTESGGVRLRPWSVRSAAPAELDEMAAAAGLILRNRWETPAGAPFDADSDRHVSVYVPGLRPGESGKSGVRPPVAPATVVSSTQVSQMRLNPLTGRWVTIVAERAERPTDFAPRASEVESDPNRPCPFCPGHEEKTLPALEQVDDGGSWRLRVVPNLYPAFDGDEPFAVHHLGPVHVMAEASGIHEVFVYTPEHNGGLHLADDHKIAEIMQALKRRLVDHASTPNIRYTQAMMNHGREAGASLTHPHGQLLGLPFVPGEILEEERAFARFESACILCATVEAELTDGKRVVFADDDVLCLSPFWAGSPFELLIIPRQHDLHLQDASDASLNSVGRAMRDAVLTLQEAFGDVAYNLVFHTAPHQHTGEFHWHVHLWPKLVTTAGFERGTGVLINIVPPEHAAEQLRRVAVNH